MMESLFSATRPQDGETIQAQFPDGNWYTVTYWAEEGIDGILEDDDGGVTEIEEYEAEMLWRPEADPADSAASLTEGVE